MLLRNPESAIHGKVKGHATDEMVEIGRVRERDKEGNDHSDAVAADGVACIGSTSIYIAYYDKHRQNKYMQLCQSIIKILVNVGRAAQDLRKRREDE